MKRNDYYLAVYGSLRNGKPDHGLLKGAKSEGDVEIKGYTKEDAGEGKFNLIESDDDSDAPAELYKISDEDLSKVDKAEQESGYERERVWLRDGRGVQAYLLGNEPDDESDSEAAADEGD